MAVSVSNVTGGPAQVKIGTSGSEAEIAHTQGGVSIRVAPQNRLRVVDKYGASPVDVIHGGDDVRITVPFAEWTREVLAQIYNPGLNDTASSSGDEYLGIGRSGGYIYTKKSLVVIPFLTAHADLMAEFYAVTPVGEFELMHNNEDDRVFNSEFVACVDTTKTDGALQGKLYIDNDA